ncbi:hypothetical protein V6N12_032705 [Hibiscus sabdariffa]|uniref:Uncharacterized protein n=1 Tax=Hibiscus sabdariffa TaxID=183260 RepID=A0ABR2BNI7_9ROSI
MSLPRIPPYWCCVGHCDLHLSWQNLSTPCCYSLALLVSGTLRNFSIAGNPPMGLVFKIWGLGCFPGSCSLWAVDNPALAEVVVSSALAGFEIPIEWMVED